MSSNVPESIRKNVTDAGYITVGLGVMGAEQVKQLGETLVNRAGESRRRVNSRVNSQARSALGRVDDVFGDVRGRVSSQVQKVLDESRARARQLRGSRGSSTDQSTKAA